MVYSFFHKLKTEIGLLFIAALFFGLMFTLEKPKTVSRVDYIAPPLEVKYLSIGFSHQTADSFWLRAIQDFDYCDKPATKLLCVGKSWFFNVINLTVELDNKFLEAYYFGGLALTVLISDMEGASIIFDKGTNEFKNDWRLLYLAGYHALFEEKNKLKAADFYLRAAEHGAPTWVRLMAGRLSSEGGNNIKAKEILQQLIESESDPLWIKKLNNKIKQMDKAQ
ncbi:hypothetical protein K2P97_09685 [bacterium]|nr:hypothetical protein [bacterium]